MAEIALGGMAVSAVLDRCFNGAENLIASAGREANIVTMRAGTELRRVIENARVAYADSLNLTMDRVDASAANVIRQLNTLVDDAQRRTQETMKQVASEVQLIALTIPLHNERPLLSSVSKAFVVVTDSPLRLKFFGLFEHASNPLYAPTLSFGGQMARLIGNQSNELTFEMPFTNVFNRATIAAARTYSFATGELRLPWPGQEPASQGAVNLLTRLIGWNAQPNVAVIRVPRMETFQITIGALPDSPGRITLEYTTESNHPFEQVKTSRSKHIDSCRGDGRYVPNEFKGGYNNDETETFFLLPTAGWRVRRHSAQLIDVRREGDVELGAPVEEEDIVRVATRTVYHKISILGRADSGKLDFCIRFTEWREELAEDSEIHRTSISLGWGGPSFTFTPRGNWHSFKVLFTPFDSAATVPPLELMHWRKESREVRTAWSLSDGQLTQGSNHSSLKIQQEGLGYKITAPIPRGLEDV
jgi:hypothetical protein